MISSFRAKRGTSGAWRGWLRIATRRRFLASLGMTDSSRVAMSPTSRRSALKLIAAGLAAPALESCTRALPRGREGFVSPSGVRLSPVRVSSDRVIRRVVGLRPFRRTGFRVEADRLGEKVIVHNYGHGGGGVSLSWGSADLAARIATDTPHREAAVIGCGVIGLSTARLLQDRGVAVTIYARDLPP